MSTGDPSPVTTMRQLLLGNRTTHLLHVAAELGLADLLADGPRTSADLAHRTGAHTDALHRVLRALADLGVFTEREDGRFMLTPLGECLRTDHPQSLRTAARVWGHESHTRPWTDLLRTVTTGEPAFERLFGTDFFSHLATQPQLADRFNEDLAHALASRNAPIVASYNFEGFDLIVDVGGGLGGLLFEILAATTHPQGIVFDLPHCEATVTRAIADAGLTERCRFEGGDFFTAVSAGAKAYLLRHVLNDWDDAHALAILASCRRAVVPTGRLLVIGWLPPEGEAWPASVVRADVNMLAVTGGRARPAEEYNRLLAKTGWRLARVIPTDESSYSLLEAVPG
ncbi:MAG TPA: methyltransferase [Thermomicrobiales bacterium]|nr:methyltransferase [Thermomicrobiales bacterium]